MKNNKKGISAVVATVLIILITVAAVTIIWAAIIPMINGQLDSSTTCLSAVQQLTLENKGYTCKVDGTAATGTCADADALADANCDPVGLGIAGDCTSVNDEEGDACDWTETTAATGEELNVQVGHGSTDFGLVDVQIVASAGGDSETVSVRDDLSLSPPGVNEERTYDIASGISDVSLVDSVSIAAVVSVGGTEKTCEALPDLPVLSCA